MIVSLDEFTAKVTTYADDLYSGAYFRNFICRLAETQKARCKTHNFMSIVILFAASTKIWVFAEQKAKH